MKRTLILALVAAFMLASVPAMAAHWIGSGGEGLGFEAAGSWRVSGNWMDNMDFADSSTDGENEDEFDVKQRARTYFTFQANENLKGVLKTEIGDWRWGNDAGEVSGDAVAIEVKNAYLDVTLPNTSLNLKAGLQGLALPAAFGGSPVFDDDVNALVANYGVNDMFSVTAGWARLYDQNIGEADDDAANNDEFDMAFLAAPITMDGANITPYGAYAWIGSDVFTQGNFAEEGRFTGMWSGVSNAPTYGALIGGAGQIGSSLAGVEIEDITAYWIGLPVEVNAFDPIAVKADFHYGKMTVENSAEDIDMSGYLFDLAVDYKMDFATPRVFFSYSNGVDEDDLEDEDISVFPTVSGFWAADTMLFDNSVFGQDLGIYQPLSMWTVGARLMGMSFIDKLSHDLGITYAKGTTDNETGLSFGNSGLLNDEESLMAIDFTNNYQIYENLAAVAEFGYAKYDMDDNNDATDDETDSAYKMAVGMKYDF